MNEERLRRNMATADAMPEVKGVRLIPFQVLKECPKCGMKNRFVPGWMLRLLGMVSTEFRAAYCKGGLDPQQTVRTLLGEREVIATCAGLQEEHLHLSCCHCSAQLLMEVKEKS